FSFQIIGKIYYVIVREKISNYFAEIMYFHYIIIC
ncbi:unnamed protein product, partial [Brassica oleracea var. botrytis]